MSELGEQAKEMSEQLLEEARSGLGRRPSWADWVAISTLMMGLLSALGALLAGITANEALLRSTQEAMDVSRVQGARVELAVLHAERTIVEALGVTSEPAELERTRQREADLAEQGRARDADATRVAYTLADHERFALSVTLLAVGISLSGISMITEHRLPWLAGLLLGLVGALAFFVALAAYLT